MSLPVIRLHHPLLIWVQPLQILMMGEPSGEEKNQVSGGFDSRYPRDRSRSHVLPALWIGHELEHRMLLNTSTPCQPRWSGCWWWRGVLLYGKESVNNVSRQRGADFIVTEQKCVSKACEWDVGGVTVGEGKAVLFPSWGMSFVLCLPS